MSTKTKVNLALLLPEMEARDQCMQILIERLEQTKGVEKAHVTYDGDKAELCLHYNPDLVSLNRVETIAKEAGASISAQYRHEQIPFAGLNTADSASNVEKILAKLSGMLHVRVNYAAGLIFVAYDSHLLSREQIEQVVRQQGARFSKTKEAHGEEHDNEGHAHGSAPTFLPHWMQERWTLLLVGLAGIFFLAGWLGETFFGLPEPIAIGLFVLAYLAGGYDVATHAIPGLLRGKFDTDVLMLAAAAGAALLGEFAEGAFLLFLFSVGHAGEHYALDRARNAVNALGALMPQTAQVKRGDRIVEEPVDNLQVGDVVVVRPGDRIPVDGKIANGSSSIDQSPITGESVPVNKKQGDEVFAGTINQDGSLDIEVTKLAQDNTLSRVMKLVAEAQSQQSPTQQFTERFTAWFVPAILIVTTLVVVIPPLAGWLTFSESFYRGMLLLVAASPCALAIGTPASVLAGIAQAARNGVLIKGGIHLENLGELNAIAFDKTGTITGGEFSVTDIIPLNNTDANELLQVAGAIEQQSNHPLALAVVRAAQEKKLTLPVADPLENVVGRGVRSKLNGEPVLIGSLKLFQETSGLTIDDAVTQQVDKLEKSGRTVMLVHRQNGFLGILGLADTPRNNAAQVMQDLKKLGIEHLVMLTGDNDDVAKYIASQVGLTDIQAELLPEDKLNTIKQLEKQYHSIAMIGDGVNDAPALATATVGIAMGGAGTAVALETADVALMADDLSKLPFVVGLSRASRAIIKQNLAISLGVIALLIVTSVVSLVPLSGAVVAHEGSTIVVVLNALRLLAYKGK